MIIRREKEQRYLGVDITYDLKYLGDQIYSIDGYKINKDLFTSRYLNPVRGEFKLNSTEAEVLVVLPDIPEFERYKLGYLSRDSFNHETVELRTMRPSLTRTGVWCTEGATVENCLYSELPSTGPYLINYITTEVLYTCRIMIIDKNGNSIKID